MKNFNNYILVLLSCFPFFNVFSQEYNIEELPTKGVFWKITGNGLKSPSYLLGTMHLIETKAILDSIPEIMEGIKKTDCFLPEVDLTKGNVLSSLGTKQEASKKYTEMKPWPADSTYQNLMSEDEYQKLLNVKIFPKEEMELYVKYFRPFSLYQLLKHHSLASAIPRKMNFPLDSLFRKAFLAFSDSVMVLDEHLVNVAKRNQKKIIPLETPESQIEAIALGVSKIITTVPYKTEIDLLMKYVENPAKSDSIEKAKKDLQISHYLNQDLIPINEIPFTSEILELSLENSQDVWYHVIDYRNNLWMEKIPVLLQTNSCFIAVGLAHLVGESGLINQLRKSGYTVERINE